MTIDDEIRDEKLHCDINREGTALSSGTGDEYGYHTDEEIVPFNQRQITEEAKFEYSPLGRAFEKQAVKQVGALRLQDTPSKKWIKTNWRYFLVQEKKFLITLKADYFL